MGDLRPHKICGWGQPNIGYWARGQQKFAGLEMLPQLTGSHSICKVIEREDISAQHGLSARLRRTPLPHGYGVCHYRTAMANGITAH